MNAKKAKTHSIDIGIGAGERKKIAQGLSALLADSYSLYLITHNFHWNVTGPQFNTLHQMFMAQYTEQWNALDLIAERIRALGHPAARDLQGVRQAGLDQGGRRCAKGDRYDSPSGRCPGSHGAHCAQIVSLGEFSERPADSRFTDPAPGSARKNRLDAAQST